MASEQLVAFQLANEEYAIPIAQVKEIIHYSGATKMPNTPVCMEGIINLRGKIIAVIDLAAKFALLSEKSAPKQALIVEVGDQEIGLVVDMVTEVMLLEEEAIEAADGIVPSNEFIQSIGKRDKRLLFILDLRKLFCERELSAMEEAL